MSWGVSSPATVSFYFRATCPPHSQGKNGWMLEQWRRGQARGGVCLELVGGQFETREVKATLDIDFQKELFSQDQGDEDWTGKAFTCKQIKDEDPRDQRKKRKGEGKSQ